MFRRSSGDVLLQMSSRQVLLLSFLLIFSCCSATLRSGKSALLIIDVQNCFTGNGSLSIGGGDEIIPVINNIRQQHERDFEQVFLTQDWHCPEHVSFASQHENRSTFDVVNLTYTPTGEVCRRDCLQKNYTVDCSQLSLENSSLLQQTLWPDHCIEDTEGSEFNRKLQTTDADVTVKKGTKCHIDSYSGFYDNGNFHETELRSALHAHNIATVFIVGLALDYCVFYTAKDVQRLGFGTFVVLDATAPVDPVTGESAKQEMAALGIGLINSVDLDGIFESKASTNLKSYMSINLNFGLIFSAIFIFDSRSLI